MSATRPLITVITAALNAAAGLAYTARSLEAQRDASFEWIVVDGGSRDDTVPFLRRHERLVARWLSEPDHGIYDAWNKGCALARGDWLLFLGAGDELAGPDTLASLSGTLVAAHPRHDLVYGRLMHISPVGRRDLEEVGRPWNELAGRWEVGRPALPPHPATFHHRSLFDERRRFDARFRVVGDSHFLLRHAMGKPPLFVPITVCRAPVGGVSLSLGSALELAREIRAMNRELAIAAPLPHRLAEHLLLAAKMAAGFLPAPMGHRIADAYRALRGQSKRWSVR